MPFNSLEFLIFFLATFGGYWLLKKSLWKQNILIVMSSYIFYGWFNFRFLIVLISITLIGYIFGHLLAKDFSHNKRKTLLIAGIVLAGGCLAVIKYFNFFVDSINTVALVFEHPIHFENLKLLLPIGLSYYVFQTIGYLVDVYRGKTPSEKNAINYFAYLSFFPSILSGPISQSTTILPQFSKPRSLNFEKIQDGIELILWGLFKKVVVADTLVKSVNYIFARYDDLTGSVLLIGVILYSFQLYADFSGYSQMAQGLGKLLGFELLQNFKFPYFSRDVSEFWRNWHRSLSAWMKDYIYSPLGSRGTNKFIHARNILLTFTFSGLWHGASWNFVIWGFLNGLYFLPLIFTNKLKKYAEPVAGNIFLPRATELIQILTTFTLISLSRVFFRTPDLNSAFGYFGKLFSVSLFSFPDFSLTPFAWVAVLLLIEWWQFKEINLVKFNKLSFAFRYLAYAGAIIAIITAFSYGNNKEYLYFKF